MYVTDSIPKYASADSRDLHVYATTLFLSTSNVHTQKIYFQTYFTITCARLRLLAPFYECVTCYNRNIKTPTEAERLKKKKTQLKQYKERQIPMLVSPLLTRASVIDLIDIF